MKNLKILSRIYPGKENQTKRLILKNAVQCFDLYGVENTSMEMICEKTKLSIGGIYYHFNTKEAITAALVFISIDDLFNYRQRYLLDAKTFEECIYALVLSYVDWIDEHPQFAKIMLSEKFDVHVGDFKNELIKRKIENRKKLVDWLLLPEFQKDANVDIPIDLYSSFINGIPEHYCKYWLLERVSHSPKHYRKEIARSVWRVIKDYQKE
jgi:AcrR family transcriptional regulator